MRFRSDRRSSVGLALLDAFLASVLAARAGAQEVRKLNTPFGPGVRGDVAEARLSADSSRGVYRADQDADEVFELYQVPMSGGPAVKLNTALAPGGDVVEFQIAPSSDRVVYRADQDADEVFELFSVPFTGRAPSKLNGVLPLLGDVTDFQISPRGSRVVYIANQDTSSTFELYSVPLTGGPATKLNAPLDPGARVLNFAISTDGSRVVYRAGQEASARLFSVKLTGGVVVTLEVPLDGANVRRDFQISPDSSRVLCHARDLTFRDRLYCIRISGGTAYELGGDVHVPGGFVGPFRISSNSKWAVFLASEQGPTVGLGGSPNLYDIYSVPLLGGRSRKLNGPREPNGFVTEYFDLSPDATRVAFQADLVGDYTFDLFSISIGGGAALQLNPPGTIAGGAIFTPDSSRVLYGEVAEDYSSAGLYIAPIAGGEALELVEGTFYSPQVTADSSRAVFVSYSPFHEQLFSVPLTGGDVTALNGPLIENGSVSVYPPPVIGTDSTTVLYLADQDSFDVEELYRVSVSGGPTQKLNPTLAPGVSAGDVRRSALSPDGTHAVYYADQEDDEVFELFSVALPDGAPVRLNPSPVRNGDVSELIVVSPDSSRVIFRGDLEQDEVFELYSVPIGGGVPVKLTPPPVADVRPGGFQVTPDSRYVVFNYQEFPSLHSSLYGVPIEGGSPVRLGPPSDEGFGVTGFQISPDSSRVLFVAEAGGLRDLYSVPITGGSATKLSSAAVAGGVFTFLISPDAEAVVFWGDLEVDQVLELYSVPLAGGAPVKLNPPLVAGGSVDSRFLISADSHTVVYRADQLADEVFELFSVPIAGGASVRLNSPLIAGGDVDTRAQISSDSRTVVYRADQVRNDVFELFSVPLAGGAVMRLNAPLVSGGSVGASSDFAGRDSYQISPDASRVVYIADQDRNNVHEIFSVPIAGGVPVRLNGPLDGDGFHGDGGDVQTPLEITDDSRFVVYLADQDDEERFELYAAPLAGGVAATKLNGPLVTDGDVVPLAMTAPFHSEQVVGDEILYQSDQDQNEVFELYLSELPRSLAARTRVR